MACSSNEAVDIAVLPLPSLPEGMIVAFYPLNLRQAARPMPQRRNLLQPEGSDRRH
jgi:hypothetical protein